ncbi:MarP family serine protease [Corynebacterium anserum]|uniref:Serine protease n=1 Tax=Corynebacterium anserum TaxID=2684406 RepID=A0A7G7YQD8_9CORY|nr:MarP family serine protease [Corynebacterium anserum]MBC2682394.1 MarP family serine protease [Corynebacterium anserum]QNH96708.1 MarP family serine protease [Corynebacterium anserum]
MSGSLLIDALLIIAAIYAMTTGYRQGGFAAILALIGVLLGGYLGVQILPHSVPFAAEKLGNTNGVRFVAALVTVLLSVLICFGIGSRLGQRLRDQIRTKSLLKVESLVGMVVLSITTMIVAWLILVPLANGDTSDFGKSVRDSKVLAAVGRFSPDWVKNLPNQTTAMIHADGFPVIIDPFETVPNREVPVPDPALQNSSVVQQTRSSIVHVVGEAEQCRRLLQGTGFALTPDIVMTNAHVVAGTDAVALKTTDGQKNATVTYYNPQEDIALLKVDDGHFTPLAWAENVGEPGDNAVVLGFPEGGPFRATPARIRDRFTISGPNIYADARVDREAYSLRSNVVQGNSGGPLINERGEVLGLIFGADMNQKETGYALTREEVMSHVGDLESHTSPVGTEGCVLN